MTGTEKDSSLQLVPSLAYNIPMTRFQRLRDELQNADDKELEQLYREITSDIYQSLKLMNPWSFDRTFVCVAWEDLNAVIDGLLPHMMDDEDTFVRIVDGLKAVRKELCFADSLFDVEQVDPLYRLVIRNKSALRLRYILDTILQSWETNPSH